MVPYSRLEYVGQAKGVVVTVIPSKKRVEVTKNKPYHFQESDCLSPESVRYYNSMWDLGLRLVRNPDYIEKESLAKEEEEVAKDVDVDVDETKQEEDLDEDLEDDTPETDPDEDDSDSEDESGDEGQADADQDDSNEESDGSESDDSDDNDLDSDNESEEITPGVVQELLEYLDLNYDEESIRTVAHNANVDLGRIRKKDSVISKILEDNPQYVIDLIKSQQ